MYAISQNAGTRPMQSFVSNLREGNVMRTALSIAAGLLLLLFIPQFASGFILAVKILQGLSVLGSIFY